MKYNVMFKILMLLLQRRKITAAEIARKMNVSVRSVYRYVEELIVCGVPVDVERGRYGGLTIADTYKLPVGYFTREEYEAIVNALDAMSSQIDDEVFASAREKLKARQKSEKRELTVCGNIIVDGGAWANGDKFREKMQICEQAVNKCMRLHIGYTSREGVSSSRTIDPYVLILKHNVWYVWAYCHIKQDFRTFKVGRIRSAAFTGEVFKKKEFTKEDIDLNFVYGENDMIEVSLEIEKAYVADAEEWLGIDNIEPFEDRFIANLSLPDDGGLVNKILSYGGAVKVISPRTLKERVKLTAMKITED